MEPSINTKVFDISSSKGQESFIVIVTQNKIREMMLITRLLKNDSNAFDSYNDPSYSACSQEGQNRLCILDFDANIPTITHIITKVSKQIDLSNERPSLLR